MRACLPFLSRISHSGCSLHDFRHDVLVRLPFALAVFHAERKPPELHQHSLFVEVVGHLLDGITGKRFGARIPVAVSVEPAIVQRCPLDAQLF